MKSLKNINILITRPRHQAETLASKIQIEGGNPIYFPTIEIVVINKKIILDQVKKLSGYHFVIFTSPNAVFSVVNFIHKIYPAWPKLTKIIAIGSGTEKALKQHNLPMGYAPEKNFSSEGILSLAPLQNLKKKIS